MDNMNELQNDFDGSRKPKRKNIYYIIPFIENVIKL